MRTCSECVNIEKGRFTDPTPELSKHEVFGCGMKEPQIGVFATTGACKNFSPKACMTCRNREVHGCIWRSTPAWVNECVGYLPMRVYLAGRYSAPTRKEVEDNCDVAYAGFHTLADLGYVPIVPHTSDVLDVWRPRDPEWWYDYTMELLRMCDALVVLPGDHSESKGTANEIAEAKRLRMRVYGWEELT